MAVKFAPPKLSLKDKHLFYLKMMRLIDDDNKKLKERIRWLSNESNLIKDEKFLKNITAHKQLIMNNQKLRELYRLKVRRYKETIKNENRFKNNGPNSLR